MGDSPRAVRRSRVLTAIDEDAFFKDRDFTSLSMKRRIQDEGGDEDRERHDASAHKMKKRASENGGEKDRRISPALSYSRHKP